MKGNMTYRRARKLNAVFLLLLFATDDTSGASNNLDQERKSDYNESDRSSDYFEQKLKEFESNKYRF